MDYSNIPLNQPTKSYITDTEIQRYKSKTENKMITPKEAFDQMSRDFCIGILTNYKADKNTVTKHAVQHCIDILNKKGE